MERITVAERRARLADVIGSRRPRAPPTRSRRRSAVVTLHSTDAATVFLSTWARTAAASRPADLERALYEERTLVRMLGMRRTLWVVPRELAPVVDAACTRVIAARERKRLEQSVEAAGRGRSRPAGSTSASAPPSRRSSPAARRSRPT